MEENPDHFISLATRALEEADREAAGDELRGRIAYAGGEAEAANAAERLSEVTPPPGWRLPVLIGAGLIALTAALALLIPEHWQELRILGPLHGQFRDGRDLERAIVVMGLAGDDVPLRVSNSRDPKKWTAQFEALIAEDPRDPAFYWQYLLANGRDSSNSGPSDYRRRWEELDPDNALWPAWMAFRVASASLDRRRGTAVVKDEARFQESLAWFQEAAQCSRCTPLVAPVMERQLRSFQDDGTLKSACMKRALRMPVRQASTDLGLLKEVLVTAAERHAAAGDREGMKRLVSNMRRYLMIAASDSSFAPSSLTYFFRFSGAKMGAACKSLGLAEEEAWLKKLAAWSSAHGPTPMRQLLEESTLSRGISQCPDITPADLKPGCMVEHAVAARFTSLAGVLVVFVVLAIGSLEVLRRGRQARGLARGLIPLVRPVDWAWILVLGVVVPLVWWVVIARISPLGRQDIRLNSFRFGGVALLQPWLSQSLGGLIFLLTMIVQTTRWRMARRVVFLSLAPHRLWEGWAMAVVAGLFIPAIGAVTFFPPAQAERFLVFGSAVIGIPLLWLLWRATQALFTSRGNALGEVLALRMLLPVWLVLGLTLLAFIPILRASEKFWMARDELVREVDGVSGATRRMLALREPDRLDLLEQLK